MPDFDASSTSHAQRCERALENLIEEAVGALNAVAGGATIDVLTRNAIVAIAPPPAAVSSAERYRLEPVDGVPTLAAIGTPVTDERLAEIFKRLSRIPPTASATFRLMDDDSLGYEEGTLPPIFLTALKLQQVEPPRASVDVLVAHIEATLAAEDHRMVILDGTAFTPSIIARALDVIRPQTPALVFATS